MRMWAMMAVAVAMAFPAVAADWAVVQDRTLGFRMEMPGTPTRKASPGGEGSAGETVEFALDTGNTAFNVTVMQMDPATVSAVDPMMVVNAGLDGAVKGMSATETGRRTVTLPGGAQAREITLTGSAGGDAYKGKALAAIKGGNVYFLIALGSVDGGAAAEADVARAVASFSVTR